MARIGNVRNFCRYTRKYLFPCLSKQCQNPAPRSMQLCQLPYPSNCLAPTSQQPIFGSHTRNVTQDKFSLFTKYCSTGQSSLSVVSVVHLCSLNLFYAVCKWLINLWCWTFPLWQIQISTVNMCTIQLKTLKTRNYAWDSEKKIGWSRVNYLENHQE